MCVDNDSNVLKCDFHSLESIDFFGFPGAMNIAIVMNSRYTLYIQHMARVIKIVVGKSNCSMMQRITIANKIDHVNVRFHLGEGENIESPS